jgi:ficolin
LIFVPLLLGAGIGIGLGIRISTVCFSEKSIQDGEDWVLVQKRGPNGFYKDYFKKTMEEYKKGFGEKTWDYWVGLENLASMTAEGTWEMKILLVPYGGENFTATYHRFKVGEGPRYELFIAHYDNAKSNFGQDVFETHNGRAFSTMDIDQDSYDGTDCSNTLGGGGGWWFNDCYHININGQDTGSNTVETNGMRAYVGEGKTWIMIKETEMNIRRTA